MMTPFLAAAIQLNTTEDLERNMNMALELIDRAADRGAELVALPENVDLIAPHGVRLEAAVELDGPLVEQFRERARRHRIWLLAGSIGERSPIANRARNTSLLLDPNGQTRAVYRKIHLFDVDLEDGTSIRESSQVEPGAEVVVADSPFGRIGLSICYDLRFPELYRELAERGAEIVMIPSAFTLHTGKDHWEVLVRARAIENGCWVIAPAQTGRHSKKRASYGNTMIVDPWGAVVARCTEGPGLCVAEIDPERVRSVRKSLPVLQHRRLPR